MAVPLNTNPKFRFVFASTNRGKLNEVKQIAASLDWECIDPVSLVDLCGPVPDVIEGKSSYRENAFLKAKAFFDWSGIASIGDDTGLEVASLDGEPGVLSARYAGEQATMAQNKAKLLEKLDSSLDHGALFRCVLCLAYRPEPSNAKTLIYAESTIQGQIVSTSEGQGGFGYDDIFFIPEKKATLAQLKESDFSDTHRKRSFYSLASNLERI